MSALLYNPADGEDPIDYGRCRIRTVSTWRQCTNRAVVKFDGVPMCGNHKRIAKNYGLKLRPGKFYHERMEENKPNRIGKDITHLIAPRRKK